MNKFCVSTAMIFGLAGAAFATDASADDTMVPKAKPAVTTKASLQPATCSSLEDFVVTACPLTWNGITVYGTIDAGVSWRSHGAPLNGTSAVGVDYLIQKYSRGPRWDLGPNALSNSNIGIKGNEPFAPGWAFIFDLQTGFDPYSLQFANGPRSVAQNAGVPLCTVAASTSHSLNEPARFARNRQVRELKRPATTACRGQMSSQHV